MFAYGCNMHIKNACRIQNIENIITSITPKTIFGVTNFKVTAIVTQTHLITGHIMAVTIHAIAISADSVMSNNMKLAKASNS